MKTKLLFALLFLLQFSNAQNIAFSDPNLKSLLLNSQIDYELNSGISFPLIDSNNDNEISQQEALAVVKLNFAYATINNLEGLQYFTNLKSLMSYNGFFTQFDFPSLTNIEELLFQNISTGAIPLTLVDFANHPNLKNLTIASTIASLDLSSNVNLERVSIFCPNLTSVNFSNLENLRELSYYGKSPTIDISDCTNLLNLYSVATSSSFSAPQDNKLTSIDLTAQTRLISLYLSGNKLTSLDLSSCTNLELVDVSDNELSELNLQNADYVKYLFCNKNQLTSLNLNGMFNLNTLDCSFNQLVSLFTMNGNIEDNVYLFGNPDLAEICCDENEIVYMENQSALNGTDDAEVNSNCNVETATLRMYPNPISDVLHLDTTGTITKVEIFGVNSLLVMQDESGSSEIDMSNLEAGIYFLKVYMEDDTSIMKLVKN
jgi:Secretion system C-terminal sorting domain